MTEVCLRHTCVNEQRENSDYVEIGDGGNEWLIPRLKTRNFVEEGVGLESNNQFLTARAVLTYLSFFYHSNESPHLSLISPT